MSGHRGATHDGLGRLALEESRQRAQSLAEGIEGWLTAREGAVLHDLASRVDPTTAIVEIGSWKGKSTVWLGAGSLAGSRARVFAVDPHVGSEGAEERLRQQPDGQAIWSLDQFRANIELAGVAEVVQPVVAFSHVAAADFERPVGLLFIDGDHSYEGVRRDLSSWLPRVVNGGTVAFHDTNVAIYPGVKRLVEEAVFRSRDFDQIRCVDSLLVARKVDCNSLLARLRNRCALVLRYPDDYAKQWRWGLLPSPVRVRIRRIVEFFQRGG